MQDEFDLDAVLYILGDIDSIEDMEKVYEIYSFVFEDDFLESKTLQEFKDTTKEHILNIHPELGFLHFNNKVELNRWIKSQTSLYGNKVTITTLGEPIIMLNNKRHLMVSSR